MSTLNMNSIGKKSELEEWRNDPKNWSSSESVNYTTFLLEKLFSTADKLWIIILEFVGVGRADFYQDPCESCKCDCDKRVHCLAEIGIGIGCININVNDNVLLNRKTVHINHFLWSIGASSKYWYNFVKKYKQTLEYKEFIINNNAIYKIEMLKHVNQHLCETMTLSEVYKGVLYDRMNYPNKETKEKIEKFINHDCREFYEITDLGDGWERINNITPEQEREMLHYKFQILTNEPHKFLNPAYKYDEKMGWWYGNIINNTENMGWWYDHVITCKECLEFLNESPTCYCRSDSYEWEDCLPSCFLRTTKNPVYALKEKDFGKDKDILVNEITDYTLEYVIRKHRTDDPDEKFLLMQQIHRHDRDHDSD
tara:strand:+ start:591 stop:1694 length:1104 start_codon:yes stop_codon:yes gene_type:complete